MVRNLSGDDAQSFIDTINAVSPRTISLPKDEVIDFDSNICVLLIRCLIILHQKSAGGVYALYTGFVAAKPWFHDLRKS